MKKTENKGLMMILGAIICWAVGAVIGLITWFLTCGIKHLIYTYFIFKIIMYIAVPFIVGFLFLIACNKKKNKNDKSNN